MHRMHNNATLPSNYIVSSHFNCEYRLDKWHVSLIMCAKHIRHTATYSVHKYFILNLSQMLVTVAVAPLFLFLCPILRKCLDLRRQIDSGHSKDKLSILPTGEISIDFALSIVLGQSIVNRSFHGLHTFIATSQSGSTWTRSEQFQ